ncbi:hypothetical protein Tco_1474724 [Tanacetum coccineum]
MSLNSFTSALEAGSEPTLWHHWIGTIPYDMVQELRSMFEKQAGVEKFDLIQSFHACKQEEGKSVADYVLKMKGYVEQLERLGYMLPQDISVGLILNGLTKICGLYKLQYDNMGKEQEVKIHAMLIEYEKGLPKKVETPQVMMIKSDEEEASWSASFSAESEDLVLVRGNGGRATSRSNRSVETEFPAIAFNDGVSSKTLSCKPTDSGNDNEKVIPLLPSREPTISCFDDLDFLKDFKNEFRAIVYNDAQTSKSNLLTEPTLSPQHINEFDLNGETTLSEYDEEEQNILYFNDLFPFNIIHPNDLKSGKDNDDNKIDIIQSL